MRDPMIIGGGCGARMPLESHGRSCAHEKWNAKGCAAQAATTQNYRRTTAAVTRTTATPEKEEEHEHQCPPQNFSRTSRPMKIGGGREIAKPTETPKKLQGKGRRRELKNTNGHPHLGSVLILEEEEVTQKWTWGMAMPYISDPALKYLLLTATLLDIY